MIHRSYKDKAFTLIELLVVISIIGLLTAVVMASLGTTRAKANDSKRVQDMVQFRTALELYALDHGGEYPPHGSFYTSRGKSDTATCGGGENWDYSGGSAFVSAMLPYLKTLPKDPKNDATHCYIYGSDVPASSGSNASVAVVYASMHEAGDTAQKIGVIVGTKTHYSQIATSNNISSDSMPAATAIVLRSSGSGTNAGNGNNNQIPPGSSCSYIDECDGDSSSSCGGQHCSWNDSSSCGGGEFQTFEDHNCDENSQPESCSAANQACSWNENDPENQYCEGGAYQVVNTDDCSNYSDGDGSCNAANDICEWSSAGSCSHNETNCPIDFSDAESCNGSSDCYWPPE